MPYCPRCGNNVLRPCESDRDVELRCQPNRDCPRMGRRCADQRCVRYNECHREEPYP
jgi:hypothetical protein